ncbi:GGDEF domain-containing protein [Neiella marina]|uniref:diguanylate cyclase n=1 Tax=Neiella holothuriorum TaxID=2870530 RepID=A0ABS7EFC0_9GAMM|nr:GGDEF domain-containing protein [Neiella holothuriorum]MBW8191044.1 GGDEF domain-containing protein [Neiella holothuriorum]
MKAIFKTEIIYLSLLLLTITLIVWQRYGMNISYSYPLTAAHSYELLSDDINGGLSIARLSFSEGYPSLHCDIVLSPSFPFCAILLPLRNEEGRGVDLSHFDSLALTLNYQSSERDTVLVYLNNGEVLSGQRALRANLEVVVPHQGVHTYIMPLDQFQVPSWWVFSRTERNIRTESKFDNVQNIQISTGDHRGQRQVNIGAVSFSFHGKWISTSDLYFYITAAWIIVAVFQTLILVRRIHLKYDDAKQEAARLNDINAFLQIERDKFETQAKYDALTGCMNRNSASDILRRVSKRFKNESVKAMLIMLDVDHFKLLNDRHGHDEGDRVLQRLVEILQQHIREQDQLIRWGGEEFIIICEQTSLNGAMTLAENLRALLESSKLSEYTRVTASFGVAEMNSLQVDQWFQQADKALYQAKNSGRNQVILAAPENSFGAS